MTEQFRLQVPERLLRRFSVGREQIAALMDAGALVEIVPGSERTGRKTNGDEVVSVVVSDGNGITTRIGRHFLVLVRRRRTVITSEAARA